MKTRGALWIPPALGVSLLINLALFGLASLLSRERCPVPDITEPVSVGLVQLPPADSPEEQSVKEPERPEPKPLPDFIPDLIRPQPKVLAMPGIEVPIDPSLLGSSDLRGRFVFNAEELDEPPRAVLKIPPAYPYKARHREIEGHVRVRFLVAENGAVSRLMVLDASPPGFFEDSVVKTVAKWKFSPGRIAGKTVAAWVVTTIRFELS